MKISYLLLTMQIFLRWLKWRTGPSLEFYTYILRKWMEGRHHLSNIPLLLNPLKRETSWFLHHDVRDAHSLWSYLTLSWRATCMSLWDFEVKPQRLVGLQVSVWSEGGTSKSTLQNLPLFDVFLEVKIGTFWAFLRPKMSLFRPLKWPSKTAIFGLFLA